MHKLQFMFSILLPLLSACSSSITQPISSDIESIAPRSSIYPLMQKELLDTFGLSKLKMGKSLQLVRIMEGGACKNTQQGAFGLFKLYANLDDIKVSGINYREAFFKKKRNKNKKVLDRVFV